MATVQQTSLLRSEDDQSLLDTIDELRSYGVNHYVPLPQLIVVGDQSTGKSSVLEAVSGVRFPIKDNLCTRFATELILRRKSPETLRVSIAPGQSRSVEEKAHLGDFLPKKENPSLEDLPQIIEDAKKVLGLTAETATFSDDVLKIEISGPTQPDLTLVDLPGLIHARSEKTAEKDIDLVSNLVREYMESSRSIILAIVSAKNDYANQVITTRAKMVDPHGLRTLGIITKPDSLDVGSDSEAMYARLISNHQSSDFVLGWHALRNRDYASRDCTDEQRNAAEAEFFSKGIWATLPVESLGIRMLKPRLRRILENQIITELPKLIQDVEMGVTECNKVLSRLGTARSTTKAQQRYLIDISDSFRNIVSAAAGGIYTDPFFGAAEASGLPKRLRATIQERLIAFAKDMREKGHKVEILEQEASNGYREAGMPLVMSRSEFIKLASQKMRHIRGCELPGTFNPSIIGDLFFEQAQPWRALARFHSQEIMAAAWACIDHALNFVSDSFVRKKLHYHVIEPGMNACCKAMDEKLEEILRPSQGGHPITYNHYFTETIQKVRNARAQEQAMARINSMQAGGQININAAQHMLTSINSDTEKDMDLYSCSEAVECMEAYYKVAMKVFIDNFAVLAIEYCVLERLSDMFTPQKVMDLDAEIVESIAGETEKSKVERSRTAAKLDSLESGLHALRRVQHYRPAQMDNPYVSKGPSVPGSTSPFQMINTPSTNNSRFPAPDTTETNQQRLRQRDKSPTPNPKFVRNGVNLSSETPSPGTSEPRVFGRRPRFRSNGNQTPSKPQSDQMLHANSGQSPPPSTRSHQAWVADDSE